MPPSLKTLVQSPRPRRQKERTTSYKLFSDLTHVLSHVGTPTNIYAYVHVHKISKKEHLIFKATIKVPWVIMVQALTDKLTLALPSL